MRRIAKNSEMSVSGLYKHFPSKEAMFGALVEPIYENLKAMFAENLEKSVEYLDTMDIREVWKNSHEAEEAMRFIYENYRAFKLLICCSQGTSYQNYLHELAKLSGQMTLAFFSVAKKKRIPIHPVSENELHLITKSTIYSITQAVSHDLSEEEAISYAKNIDRFCNAGWQKLFFEN